MGRLQKDGKEGSPFERQRLGTSVKRIILNLDTHEVHSSYRIQTRLALDSGGHVTVPVTAWSKNAFDGMSNR